MTKAQEKVLIATLCGVVIASAAAFAVQPAMAKGAGIDQLTMRVSAVASVQKLGTFAP